MSKELDTYYVVAPNGQVDWAEAVNSKEALLELFPPEDCNPNDQFLVFNAKTAKPYIVNSHSSFVEDFIDKTITIKEKLMKINTYIVWEYGNFDHEAVLVAGSSEEEVIQKIFEESNVPIKDNCLCIMLFDLTLIKEYTIETKQIVKEIKHNV